MIKVNIRKYNREHVSVSNLAKALYLLKLGCRITGVRVEKSREIGESYIALDMKGKKSLVGIYDFYLKEVEVDLEELPVLLRAMAGLIEKKGPEEVNQEIELWLKGKKEVPVVSSDLPNDRTGGEK